MNLLKRLENIWEHDKGYAIRYALVFAGSSFIHIVLGIIFALYHESLCMWLNAVSVLLYCIWLYFFSRHRVTDAMLLFPFFDVVVHACIYNILFGSAPAFFLYPFSIIPISFFLSIRDSRNKFALHISIVISLIGTLLMLATLRGTPLTPLDPPGRGKAFFQVNVLICTLLIGTYTLEFLTETRYVKSKVPHQSEYDQLTGLRNRSSLSRELSTIHGTQYCVILCDVDDFKKINDTYGHTVGDTILSLVAKTLQSCLRRDDVVCRWGGEKFLLVIRSDLDAACAAADRIRKKLCSVFTEVGEQSVSARMTYGIADCMEEDSFEKVVAIASANLAKGKRCGKNRVVTSKDDLDSLHPETPEPSLDTSELSSSIFSAFAATSDTTYLYICNMATNVSRWSTSAVEYFGLPGEYMYDAASVWMGFVHPEDRELYAKDIELVFSGKKRLHDVTYRARNKNGEYVTCVCKGVVTSADANHPPLFAGTMTNLGIAPTDEQ